MPTVVVGLDFSDPSRRALEHAITLAERLGAGLVLVHAQPKLPAGARPGQLDPITQVRHEVDLDESRRLATEWAAKAKARLKVVEAVTREGKPADVIVAEAAHRKADYVVVGSHGRTGIRKAVLGSVAQAVALASKVPVLIVPA